MKTWQITFKDGKTLEFATYHIAADYADMFGLNPPVEIFND